MGEHFWCFLFDTCSHQSPFVIYLSSWRHVTPVILQRTCDQLYFSARARDFWQSSLKKWETGMDIGAGLEPAVWFCVILYSCHGSLASWSLDYSFIYYFTWETCFFKNKTSESKKSQEAVLNGCSYLKKNQNEIYLLFFQQARTQELVLIKTSYVIILLIIIFSYGLGGGGVSVYPMN